MRKDRNAQVVLDAVGKILDKKLENPRENVRIMDVYEELSIFDWFKENLTIHDLEDMENFLKEAIKIGCTGYVCFKVGASGCANGMWAFVNESEDGRSPKGAFLYRSFTPSYTYWQYTLDGKTFFPLDSSTYKDYEKAVPFRNITKRMMERHLYNAEYLNDMEYLKSIGVA